MTKSMQIKIFSFIFALFVAIYATGTVFAWFSSQQWDMNLTGNTVGAYFAYGDGTSTKLKKRDKWKDPNVPEEWVKGTDADSDWDVTTGPFGIDHPSHMFNLAWLQNMGRFKSKNSEGDYYHFELAANVDMRDKDKTVVLPPIGNNEFPFDGVFEGNGHVISNLIISTNRDVLDDSYKDTVFANAVGLFGMTDENSEIRNFILDYPTVEVANDDAGTNTEYTDIEDESYTNDTNDALVVGLAIGYVAGKAKSIGVLGGTLAVRRENYTTFNSILGDLDPSTKDDHNHNVTGSGGSGNQFGSDFDSNGIWGRMEKIYENNGISHRLPNVTYDAVNKSFSLKELEKMPFTITSASTYEGEDAREVVAQTNVGYILGDENQIFTDTVEFGPRLNFNSWGGSNGSYTYADGRTPDQTGTIPQWFYEPVDSWAGYQTGSMRELSEEKMQQLYDDEPEMMEYIFGANDDGSYTFDSIQLGGNFTNDTIQIYSRNTSATGSGAWSPHGTIELGGQKYGLYEKNGLTFEIHERNEYAANEYGDYYEGTNGANGWTPTGNLLDDNDNCFTYDANGQKVPATKTGSRIPIYEMEEGISIPNNGIWFKPVNDGTIKLIVYSDIANTGIQLIKMKRTKATDDEPFAVDYPSARDGGNGGITIPDGIKRYVLNANILYYFEFPVDPINNYEYWISVSRDAPMVNGKRIGGKFVYLDIGSSGSVDDGTGEDTDIANPNKNVTSIDFIYDGVEIVQEDAQDATSNRDIPKGSFITTDTSGNKYIYVETDTMLKFGGSSAIVSFYYRKDEQPDSDGYTIYAAYSATSNSLVPSFEDKAKIGTSIPAIWPGVVDGDHSYYGWILS